MENQKQITIREIQNKATPIFRKYGIGKAAIFGSIAKQTNTVKSDIDLLFEPYKGMDLFDYIEIKQTLEEVFNRKVDLVDYTKIKPLIKEEILSTQIPISL